MSNNTPSGNNPNIWMAPSFDDTEETEERIPNPENVYDIPNEEEMEDEDEIERERAGRRFYDVEERQAEVDGEDLFDNDQDFVVGETDAHRERTQFAHLGLDVDKYEERYIDDENYAPLSPRHRRAVEDLMAYRDYTHTKKGHTHIEEGRITHDALRHFFDSDEEEDRIHEIEDRVQKRRKMQEFTSSTEKPDISTFESAQVALRINPRKNIFDERLQNSVDVCFRYFLNAFSMSAIEEENNDFTPHYIEKMNKMILDESTILYVNATHLYHFGCEDLLKWIEDKPAPVLEVMNDTLSVEIQHIHRELFVKIYKNLTFKVVLTDWPYSTNLRDLRCSDLNSLVRISGVINQRGNVLPILKVMYLTCSTCNITLNEQPIYFDKTTNIKFPKNCINCRGTRFTVNRLRTIYSNFQRLTLQESPGNVPAGLAARQRELIVTGEMVDKVKPGDEVEVLGIYRTKYDTGLNIKVGFPVLATEIEVNNIMRKEDVRIEELTDEDIDAIQELSKDPHIRERIIASIAPSIWGHRDLKIALAYALFGGVMKGQSSTHTHTLSIVERMEAFKQSNSGAHIIRGDINVLLLGDPGLGKSQALQYVHKTFPRTVLTNGKGASAAGLTAGVRRDPITHEWSLEGGALVLADEGICLIDEFDKMTDKDRVSIHEAMEQQTISISKAGINTALRARCSVIAAANPKHGGRYESSYTFKENVDLSDPILSRFDLIIIMKDIPNIDEDYYLAQYVITNHQLNHPEILNSENYEDRIKELENALHSTQAYQPINQELLQKYIIYARARCKPTLEHILDPINQQKLSNFYPILRQKASSAGGFTLTPRHMESIIRISEANAKMRLSHTVEGRDLDYAMATMLDSFISSQRYAVAHTLGRQFARYRILARGGFEMLIEILRRCMQRHIHTQLIQNDLNHNTHIRHIYDIKGHGLDQTRVGDQDKEIIRNSTCIEFDVFLKQALQNKFSRYHVDNWLQSDSFKSSYYIEARKGVIYIHCKPLFKDKENETNKV